MEKGKLLLFSLVALSILIGSVTLGIALSPVNNASNRFSVNVAEENGPVKFRGTVIMPEQYGEFVCYGSYYVNVTIEEILEGHPLIQDVESVEVCYKEPLNLQIEEKVEVYGYYWGGVCPLQCCGRVVASGDSYYIIRLYGVDLSCNDTQKSIPPGGTTEYTITLKNTGNMPDTINLTLAPWPIPPCGWSYGLNKDNVTLLPGESTEVILCVSDVLHSPGDSCVVTVTGMSQGEPTKSDSVTTTTTIEQPSFIGFQLLD